MDNLTIERVVAEHCKKCFIDKLNSLYEYLAPVVPYLYDNSENISMV